MSSAKSSFIGLRNQGATCYLNSLIQTLFLTPEFRQQLFSLTFEETGINTKRKKIIVELQKLFALLQVGQSNDSVVCLDDGISTKSLTNSFGWNAAQAQDQHDINELYNKLLDGIEIQMPLNKKILDKYYKGKTVNVIKCQQCEYASERIEEFVQLNIVLQDMFDNKKSYNTLQESLYSTYMDNTENLIGDNAYFCPQCDKKGFAKKYSRILKLPTIIVCNLNRFYFDLQSGERKKINKKFKFAKSLDLQMFIEHGMFYIYYPCTYYYFIYLFIVNMLYRTQ